MRLLPLSLPSSIIFVIMVTTRISRIRRVKDDFLHTIENRASAGRQVGALGWREVNQPDIELIGRHKPANEIDEQVARRMFETKGRIHLVEEGRGNDTFGYDFGHSRPKGLQVRLRGGAPARRQPVGQYNGVNASGASGGDTIES